MFTSGNISFQREIVISKNVSTENFNLQTRCEAVDCRSLGLAVKWSVINLPQLKIEFLG